MTEQEKAILLGDASTVRYEREKMANTAERVGKLFVDIINAIHSVSIEGLTEKFISKVADDVAQGRITFLQGLKAVGLSIFDGTVQFGSYVSDMSGGQVDPYGNAELNSLILRSWLRVPQIDFNRATVQLGDWWNAPGGGTIESVEIDRDANGNILATGTITLRLEEGEIGAVAIGDICKGYFHDFATPANNALSDSTKEADSFGNAEFAGFCTGFFTVTEIVPSDGVNKKFKYMLRPEEDGEHPGQGWHHSFHPCKYMQFVAYGNFEDPERQRSAYHTRGYTRFLQGVNTWEFSLSNIAMQFGDLTNLNVDPYNLNMVGYSAYLQNIYMSGTISNVHIEVPETIEVTSDGDNFIADGETLTLTATAKKGWETLTPDSWSISRYTGDTAADSAWDSAHASFAGTITMTQADIGATTLNATAIFTITATGDGWTVSKQIVLRTLRLPSTLSMRFVSEYGAYDTFITYGDTVKFQALIEDGLRNDYTAEYDQWSIQRYNGDTPDDIASDGVWNVTRAAISSTGVFSIEWSAQHDDLQAERATFIVTAQKGSAMATQITGTLSI